MRDVQLFLKRTLDILISVLGILVLLVVPVFLIVFLAIRLGSKGPAVFRQQRAGKNKKIFSIYKFRTMITERYGADGQEIMSENRITRIGRFLRKTSLDELPQLFNVLFGQMSLVGPRPMLPYQAERCIGEENKRFLMRPGITGLAQAKGRNDLLWEDRIQYDIEYVENYSLLLDLKVIVRTIALVFQHKGTEVKPAYRGMDRFSIHYKGEEKGDSKAETQPNPFRGPEL